LKGDLPPAHVLVDDTVEEFDIMIIVSKLLCEIKE
jgi:hypothetical protein